jgi:hypothetical protein
MKFLAIKILPFLILFTISVNAQISSNPSAIHGSYKKGDTITEYDDKPSMHSHESVTIIKEKKLTPEEAAKAGVKVPPYMHHKGAQAAGDTTPTPDTVQTVATGNDTAAAPINISENTLIMASGCDCVNKSFIYDALGLFALAFFLSVYLFILLLRDQKRPPFIASLHAMLVTAGMTLLIVFSIYQPFPTVCLTILVLAALSSIGLLYYDVTGRTAPKGLAILHGALALIGVILLLIFAFAH